MSTSSIYPHLAAEPIIDVDHDGSERRVAVRLMGVEERSCAPSSLTVRLWLEDAEAWSRKLRVAADELHAIAIGAFGEPEVDPDPITAAAERLIATHEEVAS